jgi:hypothetical protein
MRIQICNELPHRGLQTILQGRSEKPLTDF